MATGLPALCGWGTYELPPLTAGNQI